MTKNKEKTYRQPKFYVGIIFFIISVAVLIFPGSLIQMKLGMPGVVITELIFLLLSIAAVYIMRYDIKEVFPIKKIEGRKLGGTFVLAAAGLIGNISLATIIAYFFPEMLNVSSELLKLMGSGSVFINILAVCIMAPICEESLMRGFTLYTFKNLKYEWVKIVVIGVMFGVLHLDPYRFLPTALLGMLLAYILLKTNNIFYCIILHCVNNLIPQLISITMKDTISEIYSSVEGAAMFEGVTETTQPLSQITIPLTAVGVYMIFFVAVPWLLIAGSRLIKDREYCEENKIKPKVFIIAVIISAVLFLGGIAVISLGTIEMSEKSKPVYTTTTELILSKGETDEIGEFTITEGKNYKFLYYIDTDGGYLNQTEISVINSDTGETVCTEKANTAIINSEHKLEAGTYKIETKYDFTDSSEHKVSVSFSLLDTQTYLLAE